MPNGGAHADHVEQEHEDEGIKKHTKLTIYMKFIRLYLFTYLS